MLPNLTDDISRKVEFLSKYRFKSHISVTSIYKWLDNFEEEEIPIAIKILEHLEFFSSTDLSAILQSQLKEYLDPDYEVKGGTKLHFVPLGKPGKSGFVILYLIKNLFKKIRDEHTVFAKGMQEPAFYSRISEIKAEELKETDHVFFVDDIIGSGDTFLSVVCSDEQRAKLKIYTTHTDNEVGVKLCAAGKPYKVYLLACIVMNRAKAKIEKEFPHISVKGEIRQRIFEKGGSPFHSYKTILETREMSYKYGMLLMDDKSNALGYGNSQSLVIFEHATPNNTLPIIWKGSKSEGFKWDALKPRSHRDRITYAIEDRDYNTQWLLSLSELFGVEPDELHGSHLVSKDNYDVTLVLRLLHAGLSDIEIAIVLGMPLGLIEGIKEKGIGLGLWDENFALSGLAKNTLLETEKYLSLFPVKPPDCEPYDDRNIVYIPESFGGIS